MGEYFGNILVIKYVTASAFGIAAKGLGRGTCMHRHLSHSRLYDTYIYILDETFKRLNDMT